jgi:RNA polymerase sigma-70 factor (ECF subfamily)
VDVLSKLAQNIHFRTRLSFVSKLGTLLGLIPGHLDETRGDNYNKTGLRQAISKTNKGMRMGVMKNDAELVRSLQNGNRQALGFLYERHKQQVYQTALAITGDVEAAADLLQEVFLRLFRYARTVDSTRPIQPWLYRVTVNLCYTWLRGRKHWLRPLDDIAHWLTGNEDNPASQEKVADEDWQTLQKALSALPVAQRSVVVLYYLNGLSIEEIANSLDVPLGTIKSRLHYGRQALKKHMLAGQGEKITGLGYEFT